MRNTGEKLYSHKCDSDSNFFLFGIPIGGAAGDQVKAEQVARDEQNRINEEKQRVQIEQERIANEQKDRLNEIEAEARRKEIELQAANVKAKELELKLREAEALQKIEFQRNIGTAAVDRATKLNEAEFQQEVQETKMMPNQMYMIGGGILLVVLILVIAFK